MENEKEHSMKKIGLIVGFLLILVGAVFSAFIFIQKITLNQSGLDYEMMPEGNYAGNERSFLQSPTSLSKDANFGDSGENFEMAEENPVDVSSEKKIIKNGNLTMKVNDINWSQGEISKIAKENGGDIFSSNVYQSKNNLRSGNIVVKVPVANFEKTFSAIKTTGSLVVREATSGRDVTEEYQDLESRIKNKQSEEEAYKKILEQAQKISDILEVTRALSRVRGEIESYQGQLKYLASQADMSTININLSEDQNITTLNSWRPFQVAKDAVNSLLKSIQGFLNFIIVLVIIFIPTAVLYLLTAFIIYLVVKKIYQKFRKNKE